MAEAYDQIGVRAYPISRLLPSYPTEVTILAPSGCEPDVLPLN